MATETKIDPFHPPTITLSAGEIDDLYAKVEAGELPRDYMDRYFEAVGRNVFGADAKKDGNGHFVEQGIGSEFGMTQNSIDAYRKYGAGEPDFEKNLARMQKQLDAANARRRAERDGKAGGNRRYSA